MSVRIALLATLAAYSAILVAYGHAGLPLALGVPVVVLHFAVADRAMLVPSLLGLLGGLLALLALALPCKTFRFRAAILASLASLAASAWGFLWVSESRLWSLVTAGPFAVLWASTLVLLAFVDLRAKRRPA